MALNTLPPTGRHRVHFGGSTVAVDHAGPRAAALVDRLCRHLPAPPAGADQPVARLAVAEAGGMLALSRDDEPLYRGDDAARLAEMLLGELGHRLAYHSRGGLLFHAGVLERDGRGLLLPGAIAAGKTTLTAWLALTGLAGLAYLSDELAFFPHGSAAMQAYTRPLNVKRGARAPLGAYFDFAAHAGDILSTSRGDLIPPERVSFRGPRRRTALRLILFPRYTAGSALELEPLTGAQAGLALMECLVNARNLSHHGFDEVARLARAAPAYRLRYAHFEQIEARLTALVERHL